MYVKISGGVPQSYPYSYEQLIKDNPTVSFPQIPTTVLLETYGLFPVVIEDDPAYDPNTHKITVDALPTFEDPSWVLKKNVVSLSVDEVRDVERLKFRASERAARTFDYDEVVVLLAAYLETQLWRVDNTAATPLIDAINAVFPGQTKAQIGTTVENRVQSYLVASATALAQKIKDTP